MLLDGLYRAARPLLFRLAPEAAHRFGCRVLAATAATPTARARWRQRIVPRDDRLAVDRLGLRFPHPVGLAAGFDKEAACPNAWAALGFAFVEFGTVTARPCAGQPRPRLFRLPADEALLNRLGFPNPGAEVVAGRLRAAEPRELLWAVNVAKHPNTPLEGALEDVLAALEAVAPVADFVVLNVSSPNSPGLRRLQEATRLRSLLEGTLAWLRAHPGPRGVLPLLVKIAPDLDDAALDELADLAADAGAAGIVATNTTVERAGLRSVAARTGALGPGGISGRPLAARAEAVLRRLYRRVGDRLVLVGVGGIADAEDAWRRLRAGASLLELYTALVYRGPGVVGRILRGLRARLDESGLPSLSAAIGCDA